MYDILTFTKNSILGLLRKIHTFIRCFSFFLKGSKNPEEVLEDFLVCLPGHLLSHLYILFIREPVFDGVDEDVMSTI